MRRPSKRSRPLAAALSVLLAAACTLPTAAPAAECLDCHAKDGDAGGTVELSLLDGAAWAASIHADLECDGCHEGADDYPHDDIVTTACADCHDDASVDYEQSIHAFGRRNGAGDDAPACGSCHGNPHEILPASDEESPVHPKHLPKTCGACHSNPELVKKYGILVARPVAAYRRSVHAQRVAEGIAAASCVDCHGSHAIFRGPDPRSSVFHLTVPNTCGKCHANIAQAFTASVHGTAVAKGVREAPVCTDCHGEHRILSPHEKSSPVYATNIPRMTCGRCHQDLRLNEKYGIPSERVETYRDSYHGLAARAGRPTVANCASCHGVHDIQPSSDSRSHVHPSNLAKTCGACHPGAGARFAIGTVHALPSDPNHPAVYYARLIYLWLIYLTVGAMLLHNGLDFLRKLRSEPRWREQDTDQLEDEAEPRMLPGFRIAHGLLVFSFAVLAYTGFALKFPESWWAAPMLRWEAELDVRGWAHRTAALIMISAFVFHLLHLAVDSRARRCIAQMVPRRGDLVELGERIAYFRGRRKTPPKTATVGYPEKLEYLALWWGTIVMVATGLMLWYENLLLAWLPKWVGDLATAIHFYEAILATCAILVWHFYFVIFDPVVYPMDRAWLTGHSPPARDRERRDAASRQDDSRPNLGF